MRITMIYTRRGSEDGSTVRRFLADETYEVADSLARYFIRQQWAYEADLPKPDVRPVASPFAFKFPEPQEVA